MNDEVKDIPPVIDDEKFQSLKNITAIVYILQILGFVIGLTFIAGVIVNYIKLSDVQGTIFASHFKWQIRTFWYGLLWGIIGVITVLVLVGYVILFANAVWVIYRIVKGWLYLSEKREMYT